MNELQTRTGPGTPCGELLRRYWQPVALSEELPPGGAPLPVQLMSEELVLFRDEQGRPGLLGLHCAHRGADLSYGRLEDGGLRCLYHGWLYDVAGRCLQRPGEPPLLPNYEFLAVPEAQRYATKYYQDCNYLQGSEGNIDPVQNNLLHHP